MEPGDLVLIYISYPVQALVGAFKVDQIVEKPLKELWQMVQKKAGVTHQEFENYYEGVSVGVGIFWSVQNLWLRTDAIIDLKLMNLQLN